MSDNKNRKLFQELYKKVQVQVWVVGQEQPFTGAIHVDKTIRLSDHLNLNTQEFIILTGAEVGGRFLEALFVRKDNIVAITPVGEE